MIRMNWAFLGLLVAVLIVLIVLTGCVSSTKVICPQLAPPPASIVDSLEYLGAADPSAAAWTIGLAKQYQKQELCRG